MPYDYRSMAACPTGAQLNDDWRKREADNSAAISRNWSAELARLQGESAAEPPDPTIEADLKAAAERSKQQDKPDWLPLKQGGVYVTANGERAEIIDPKFTAECDGWWRVNCKSTTIHADEAGRCLYDPQMYPHKVNPNLNLVGPWVPF